ncbi:MAG: HlyD family efflux transporter periplasmic adaptor subunit [Bythopirellula sp.]
MQDPQQSEQWLQLRPRLRTDLSFRPQRIGGRSIYIVEDPLRTKFFRLGRPEYLLAAAFDGQTTLQEALAQANCESDEAELTGADAVAILNWATGNELLELAPERATAQPIEPAVRPTASQAKTWNPVCFRLPLGSLEPWIARCYPYLAWIYSSWMTLAGITLIVVGLAAVVAGWDRLVVAQDQIFSPTGQLSLLVCWVVLKVVHEFSHGLVCRRYGAPVGEAGLMFIVMLPIAYVDVTAAWRIRSRWQRIHIAAAGMQLELYVAAVAAIVWSCTAPGILNQLCANLVLMAGVTTLLFNANPLMRFDGYYILTDLMEMPNLAVTAQTWLRGWANRFFLALPAARIHWPEGRATFTRVYAVSAFIWRIMVCVGLLLAAAAMWHGAGLVLACFAALMWFGQPLIRLVRLLQNQSGPVIPNRRHFATVMAAIAMISTLGLSLLPWPGVRQVSGIVDYEPMTVLRADVDGFVDRVLVRSGEVVAAGQELAVLRNDQLVRDLEIQRLKVEASRLQIRALRGRRELAALAAETEQLVALETQLAELVTQVQGLTVRAPVAGCVVSRDVESRIGSFLNTGDVLLSLGSEDQKRIAVSLPQRFVSTLQAQSPVTVAVDAETTFNGQIDRLEPRASVSPIDKALCAPFGGQLLVRETPTENSAADVEATYELLQPHFTGTILLDADRSARLLSGQRAQVILAERRERLGPHLWDLLLDWLDRSSGNGAS